MANLTFIADNRIFLKAFTFITKFNEGYNNPYHNNDHLVNVFNNATEICLHHGLDTNESEICGLAALFHDFNHNGTVGQDDINIPVAIDAFKIFWETMKNDLTDDIYYEYIIRVPQIINMTRFPNRPKGVALIERIIQDADMLTLYNADWRESVIEGLAKEYNIPIKKHINNQTGFINNLEFCTVYAKNKHIDKKRRLLKDIEYLKVLYS